MGISQPRYELFPDSPVPIYYQLRSILQKDIEDGRLKPGDAILPERKMAEHYGVSIGSIRQAIAELVKDGLIIRKHGAGTFVAGTNMANRYYRVVRDFTGPEATLKIKFQKITKISGIREINAFLGLDEKKELFELERIILVENKPSVYSVSYLPFWKFQELDNLPAIQFEINPLYFIIEKKFAIPTLSFREMNSAILADRKIAANLQVQVGSPILLIEMIGLSYKKKAYEYRKSYCLTGSNKILRG
jgi:GntR family transcriptional regulator